VATGPAVGGRFYAGDAFAENQKAGKLTSGEKVGGTSSPVASGRVAIGTTKGGKISLKSSALAPTSQLFTLTQRPQSQQVQWILLKITRETGRGSCYHECEFIVDPWAVESLLW
jgi:hypothetical protein